MKKLIYTAYANETDTTIIFEDTINENGELVSTEIKGFYYGAPWEEYTEECYGKLKATFEGES